MSLHLSSFSRGLRVVLATLVVSGGFLISDDADARGFGRKAGWNRGAVSADSKSTTKKRGGLFSRLKKTSAPKPVVANTPRRASAPTTPTASPTASPRRAAAPTRVASQPKPAPSREVARTKPTRKRGSSGGLLSKLFGSGDRTQAAARSTSSTGLRPIDPKPAPPKLAPGQPNWNQSAPKINHTLIANSSKSASSVTVNIARQRAYVYIAGKVAVDTPISTARTGKYTPRGTFYVSERVHSGKISTIYKVEMPRWMRLGGSAYGMHAGYLPGYPASAGCIRMPFAAADAVYRATKSGTRVKIISG